MKNKRIILFFSLVFAILFIFMHTSFAANEMHQAENSVDNTLRNAGNMVVEGSEKVTGTIENGLEKAGESVQNTMSGAGNMIKDSGTKIENGMQAATQGMTDSGNYSATRTSTRTATTNPTVLGMNSTVWTIMIVVLTAIGIGSIIWFYNSAKSEIRDRK